MGGVGGAATHQAVRAELVDCAELTYWWVFFVYVWCFVFFWVWCESAEDFSQVFWFAEVDFVILQGESWCVHYHLGEFIFFPIACSVVVG